MSLPYSLTSTAPDEGGNDMISLGNGTNVVIGGDLDDTITTGVDADYILGDNAFALMSCLM